MQKTLIIGIGSGGSNIINNLSGKKGLYADFCIIDNDLRSINNSSAEYKIHIKQSLEDKRNSKTVLRDFKRIAYKLKMTIPKYKNIYLISCLGGIFASSVIPYIIKLISDDEKLDMAILIKPFKALDGSVTNRAQKCLDEIDEMNIDVNILSNEAFKIVSNKSMTVQEFYQIYNKEVEKILLKNNSKLNVYSQDFLNECLNLK